MNARQHLSAIRALRFSLTALLVFFGLGFSLPVVSATPDAATIISDQINPARLATLGPRAANARVQKCVYWLAAARQEHRNLTTLLDVAVTRAGYTNALAAQLTREALLRNLDIADKLGCLDAEGLSEMRHGKAATVRTGPYTGDQLSVDHIIPRAVCVQLDNVIANLEFMPQRMNSAKGDRIGQRQVQKAEELHRAGLLADSGLQQVQVAARKQTAAHLRPTASLGEPTTSRGGSRQQFFNLLPAQ
jgi:hypothetical protein